jgi:hypothetical protein
MHQTITFLNGLLFPPRMATRCVVLDTNMLLAIGRFGINLDAEMQRLFGDYSLAVVEGTIGELKEIAEKKSVMGSTARLALRLIDEKNITKIANGASHPDDQIIAHLTEHDCIVATQDKLLKERAQQLSRKVLIIRGKNHFELM